MIIRFGFVLALIIPPPEQPLECSPTYPIIVYFNGTSILFFHTITCPVITYIGSPLSQQEAERQIIIIRPRIKSIELNTSYIEH